MMTVLYMWVTLNIAPRSLSTPDIKGVRSRIGTGIRIRPSGALHTEERCTCFLDQCKGSPIVPTEVKDSTSVPGLWFRSIYVPQPQVHRGTGHFPRGPLNTIRRTPLSRGNGRSIIIMAGS